LEIFAIAAFLFSWRDSLRRRKGALWIAAVILVAFDLLVFYLIDVYSVVP